MELIGKWKLKETIGVSKTGFRRMNAEELASIDDNDANKQFKRMLRAVFIISESSLDIYIKPTESEAKDAEACGKTLTEEGILLESFPARIENGVLMLDYKRSGADYSPCWTDEDGTLSISGGLIKIVRAD